MNQPYLLCFGYFLATKIRHSPGKRKDQSVGTATLELASLKSNETLDKWVDLCSEGQVVGSLRFKVGSCVCSTSGWISVFRFVF